MYWIPFIDSIAFSPLFSFFILDMCVQSNLVFEWIAIAPEWSTNPLSFFHFFLRDAVLWLEEYLSNWDRILFFVCHSQDFLNNVCTHIVRLDATYKKLRYYSGNYDTYVQTRRDQDMVQMRQYEAEQRDIAEIKDFIARFGHGTWFFSAC